MDSMDSSAVQRVPGRPVGQQCLDQSRRAKAAQSRHPARFLTIYGAKTGRNPKTRDDEHAPPGPFFVGPTSRSDPTLGQCFYTTFCMQTVHLNRSGIFRLSSDAPRRRWRRPRRRWRWRWRRVRPPGGRGRCSSNAFGLRTAGRHRTRCQKRPAEGRLRADSAHARA